MNSRFPHDRREANSHADEARSPSANAASSGGLGHSLECRPGPPRGRRSSSRKPNGDRRRPPTKLAGLRSPVLKSSFVRLVERHTERLNTLANRLTRDADEADDLVQETWLRAYLARASYRPTASIWSWIAAICTNAHIDRGRAETRRRQRELTASFELPNESISVEEALSARARRAAVRAAIELLPPREREVVQRRAYAEQATEVIAREMRCAPSTVRAAATHACHRLRPMLVDWSD